MPQSFKIKEIRHRSLDFVCLFILGHSPVQLTCGFMPLMAANFRHKCGKFQTYQLAYHRKYMLLLSYTLIKNLLWYVGRLNHLKKNNS